MPKQTQAQLEAQRRYKSKPEVKAHYRAYMAAKRLHCEFKAKENAYNKIHKSLPHVVAKHNERQSQPKWKAYKKAWKATPTGQASQFKDGCRRRKCYQSSEDSVLIYRWVKRVRHVNAKTSCYWCQKKNLPPKDRHIDHILPVSKGGEHTISNLCISCSSCNHKKHARTVDVWNQFIEQPVLL